MMMQTVLHILVVFGVAWIAALLLVPVAKRLAPTLRMIDAPSDRRIHKAPVPRSGGLAVFFSVHLSCALYFLLMGERSALPDWLALLSGSGLIVLVGLLDDRHGLSVRMKLAGQIVASLFMFYCGFSMKGLLGLDIPFWINLPATVFWFVLVINAFNLIDGMDGACAGLGMISATGMAATMMYLGQFELAVILFALAGACFGFLRYNFHPASVFLGDCGSMLIGFLLAGVFLHASSRQSAFVTLLVPMLAVGVPLFDVGVAVWRRIAKKIVSRLHDDPVACRVFGPDLDHIHHKLIDRGLTQRHAAGVLYVGGVVACLLAFTCVAYSSIRLAIILAGVTVILHAISRHFLGTELRVTTQAMLKGFTRPSAYWRDLILIGCDLAWLSFSACLTLWIAPGRTVFDMAFFGMVLIPFAVMYICRTYQIIWSRSRISQMVVLALELFSSSVLVLFFLWALDGHISFSPVLLAFQHWQTMILGLLAVRAAPRVLRDAGSYLSMHAESSEKNHALLFGGGSGALLFLRRKAFYEYDRHSRKLIGIIDDNPCLFRRRVYGYPVLGARHQIEEIIRKHDIREVILTEDWQQPEPLGLIELAERYNLKILRFRSMITDTSSDAALSEIPTLRPRP